MGAEAWAGALAARTSSVPWGAVASVAAWAVDASPADSSTATVPSAWPYPLGYYDDWYSGYYDPSTVTPDEQPTYPTTAYPYVKPPRSSCSTQTYKVPSENGGEASINVVRC